MRLVKPIEHDEEMLRPKKGKKNKTVGGPCQVVVPNSRDFRSSRLRQCNYQVDQQYSAHDDPSRKSDRTPDIRQVRFEMALRDENASIVHVYTSIQCKTASAPRLLEEEKDWRDLYPGLVPLYDEGSIRCPIYLLDASLSLTYDFLPGSKLSIDISLIMSRGVGFHDWKSLTRFYEDNGRMIDLEAFYAKRNKNVEERKRVVEQPWRQLISQPSTGSDIELSQIPLKSAWWGQTFSDFISVMRHAEANDNDLIENTEEDIDQKLRGISVLQEIWATPKAPQSYPQRLAILAWRFSKAKIGQVGTTSWRTLMQDTNPFAIQSPSPKSIQPPLILDTAIRDALNRRPFNRHVDYYNPQPSIFVDNGPETAEASMSIASSAATTPSMDYASFPSSTSTSFPSTLPYTDYTPDISQGSSFQSQEPLYSQPESFHYQDPHFQSQELLSQGHEVYDSQANLCQAQDALYPHDNGLSYDWTGCQSIMPDDMTASYDFTGGKIQISYPGQDEPLQAYDMPLIAPRANTLPQHRLIQFPEQVNDEDYVEAEQDQQSVDWEAIASQPLQVADLRFNPDLTSDFHHFEDMEEHASMIAQMSESQEQMHENVTDGESQRQGNLVHFQ